MTDLDSSTATDPVDRAELASVTGLRWVPLSTEEIPRWHPLVEAANAADESVEHHTVEDLGDELAPWVDLDADTALAVDEQGRAVAFGLVQVRPSDVTLLRGSCWGAVHPDHRGRGIGRALLGWQLARARALVQARRSELGTPDVAGRVGIEVDVDRVPAAARLAERAGLQPQRWFSVMRRELDQPVPAVELPAGLRMVGYEPDLDDALRLAHNEAFTDHWGFQPWSGEMWAQWSTGHRSFRPDWTFLVMDGDEVAGYAVNHAYESDWEAQGYTEGWTAKLGVRAAWRGKGLAKAVLASSMAAFKADGMHSAGLDVDSENELGAVKLYQGLGYRVDRRTAMYGADA